MSVEIVTAEQLAQVESSRWLQNRVRDLVSTLLASIFWIDQDYSRWLPEMIKAGKYDYFPAQINSINFPLQRGVGIVSFQLVLAHFDKEMDSERALRELDKIGLRAATLSELLALGESFPELQRKFEIVTLGSSFVRRDGRRSVTGLDRWLGGRKLDLLVFQRNWGERVRFAAVPKEV